MSKKKTGKQIVKKVAKKNAKKKATIKVKVATKKKLNVGKELVKRTKDFNKNINKIVKKKPKKVLTPEQYFGEWWNKVAQKKVDKIEKRWIKENEPNDPNEEEGMGGDHWCVNQMMHEGEANNMTYDIAEQVFLKGYNGEAWKYGQEDSLYCELDDVICEAYDAGRKAK